MTQPELPILYIHKSPNLKAEPKVEPHRAELDGSVDTLLKLVHEAVETPSAANLRNVTDAILRAHQDLLTLNYVENGLR